MKGGRIVEGRALAVVAGLWLGLGIAAQASAYIRIDEFDDAQELSLGTAETDASDAAMAPGVLGGERDLVLERLSGTGEVAVAIDPGGSGLLFFENAASAQTALTIVYDGLDSDPETVDPNGLGNVDLTELGTEEQFAIRMRTDQEADVTIQIFDATDPSGQTWSVGGFPVTPGNFQWFTLPLAAMAQSGPGGPADPTDVGAIVVRVSGPQGLDVQIDSIRVPEPGALSLGVAVLCTLAGLRRVSA